LLTLCTLTTKFVYGCFVALIVLFCFDLLYIQGWLALRIYDNTKSNSFDFKTGIGPDDELSVNVVKSQEARVPVMYDSESYNVDEPEGPSGLWNSHPERLKPVRTTAEEINAKSVAFQKSQNEINYYSQYRSELRTSNSHSAWASQTCGHLRHSFTTYDGNPNYRLKGQAHDIDWTAASHFSCKVESMQKEFQCHLSGIELSNVKVKNYPRGGCCNCGVALCFGCISC
jgi:hypothetical protein